MTYRDMTFCVAKCKNVSCLRNEENLKGKEIDAPVAYSNFSDNCEEYEIQTDFGEEKCTDR